MFVSASWYFPNVVYVVFRFWHHTTRYFATTPAKLLAHWTTRQWVWRIHWPDLNVHSQFKARARACWRGIFWTRARISLNNTVTGHDIYSVINKTLVTCIYIVVRKNVTLYFCPYLCQLLTDFQNSFTGTLSGQFAIMRLLYIPPYHKCVFTLFCGI